MTSDRLKILFLTPMPPSPPRFGAQARMHGLIRNVALHHDVTVIALVDREFDRDECERALREYCRHVVLVRNAQPTDGPSKRLLQARALLSRRSFERHRFTAPALQPAIDAVMRGERFDAVAVEFPYLAHHCLPSRSRDGPVVIVDAHEIAHDLARQFAGRESSAARRLYAAVNWRKLRDEERAAFEQADGVCTCSEADRGRVLAEVPTARVEVVPNGADVEQYQPRPTDPSPDGRTAVFFGLLSTFPNVDAVTFLAREIWPRVTARRSDARCRILGARPAQAVQQLQRPSFEVVGFVEDLRPQLASAAAVLVPLRIGGGTRLKILEAMAMARPVVSTTLGAEGIDAMPDRDILIADDPPSFARAVIRLLDDPEFGARMGASARRLVVARYGWGAAAQTFARFCRTLIDVRAGFGRGRDVRPSVTAPTYRAG